MNSQPLPSNGELYRRIHVLSPWHAWLYRASERVAMIAAVGAVIAFGIALMGALQDGLHQRWAGLPHYLGLLAVLVVPFLGIVWVAAILHHRLYLRYHAPNTALQPTAGAE